MSAKHARYGAHRDNSDACGFVDLAQFANPRAQAPLLVEIEMQNLQWREQTGGVFIAETADFSLKVYKSADRRYVRYLVLKRHMGGADELVGSGTFCAIGEAMNAAEKMAERLRAVAKRENLGIVPHQGEEVWEVAGLMH